MIINIAQLFRRRSLSHRLFVCLALLKAISFPVSATRADPAVSTSQPPTIAPLSSPALTADSPPTAPTTPTPTASKPAIVLPNALSHLLIDGALDLRFRNSNTGRTNSVYIQSVELDLQEPIDYHLVQQGSVFVQMMGENPPDVIHENGIKEFAIGEAYISYRLPVATDTDSSAYVKIGQFTLPVGLMATYDTHQEILQSLYPEGIGERTDWGVALDGRFYGVLDYNFAVTAGSGPGNIYGLPDRVVSFRLGRLFVTQYGDFNLGGSLLGGRLPVTEVDPITGFAPMLPPSGKVTALFGYEEKSRIIGDGQWTYKNISARGEAMFGTDTNSKVDGSFVETDYNFAPGLAAVLADSYWDYGRGGSTSSDVATGLNISYGRDVVVRVLYEFQQDIVASNNLVDSPLSSATNRRQIATVQFLLRF